MLKLVFFPEDSNPQIEQLSKKLEGESFSCLRISQKESIFQLLDYYEVAICLFFDKRKISSFLQTKEEWLGRAVFIILYEESEQSEGDDSCDVDNPSEMLSLGDIAGCSVDSYGTLCQFLEKIFASKNTFQEYFEGLNNQEVNLV